MATHKGFTASQRVSKNAGLIVPVGAALGLFLDPLVNVQTLCPRSPGQELLNTSATFGAGDVQCVLRAVLLVRQAWPGPLDQFGVPPVGCTRRRCITGFRLEQDLSTVEHAYRDASAETALAATRHDQNGPRTTARQLQLDRTYPRDEISRCQIWRQHY